MIRVDFGIRLFRYREKPGEEAHAYDERILTSLSEDITTVRLSDHLLSGGDPNFEARVLMAHLAVLFPSYSCCDHYGSDHDTQCHSSPFAG